MTKVSSSSDRPVDESSGPRTLNQGSEAGTSTALAVWTGGYWPYWVRFADGSAVCSEGLDAAEAAQRARDEMGKKVVSIDVLPYPAKPILERPPGATTPIFCYRPEECAGRTYCRRNPACNE